MRTIARAQKHQRYRRFCVVRKSSILFNDHAFFGLTVFSGSDPPAWKRLISRTLTTQERVSLITTIFSERDGLEVATFLSGEDAQAFIDVVDEVRPHTLQPLRDVSSTPTQNLCILLDRSWITSDSRSAGDACALYTGFVLNRLCSRNHWQFHSVTAQRGPRSVVAVLRMCGRPSMMVRR